MNQMSTHVTSPAWVLRSVSVLTAADEHKCWAPSLIPVRSGLLPSESVYWPTSEVTSTPQQIAQTHSHILNLEPLCYVQVQMGLLLRPEVGCTVEPPADLMGSSQVERADWGFTPHHLQLQSPTGLILAQALVTHVHVQYVGPGAVDVDPVAALVNQTHPIAAANVTKLKRSVACGIWRVWGRGRRVTGRQEDLLSWLWNLSAEQNDQLWSSDRKTKCFVYSPAVVINCMWTFSS